MLKYPRVQEVVVSSLKPANPATPKGARTWILEFPKGDISGGRTMVAQRFNDEDVGHHWHPRCPSKDPEIHLFTFGRLVFHVQDLAGAERSIHLDTNKHGPAMVLTPPYILHWVQVESDQIWFLEQQSTAFDLAMNRSIAEFEELRASIR
jgi:hypothetical protein